MSTINYTTFTDKEIQHHVTTMTLDELKSFIPRISQEQIEIAAHVMALPQFIALISQIKNHPDLLHVLPPLVIGFPYPQFMHFLQSAPKQLLDLLKQESRNEGVQYQLTLCIHEFTEKILHQEFLAEEINKAIDAIDCFHVDISAINQIVDGLNEITIEGQNLIEQLAIPLELAWNTGRADIIDRMSYLREHVIHLLATYVGAIRNKEYAPTGLYALLEQRLNDVYGTANQQTDITALKDDEPAIEGLTKLGIWHFKDYWQLGLLPNITPKQLETHEGANMMQQDLLKTVRNNLQKIHLLTVRDLKQAHIYSRQLLQKYVASNIHLL